MTLARTFKGSRQALSKNMLCIYEKRVTDRVTKRKKALFRFESDLEKNRRFRMKDDPNRQVQPEPE